MSWPSVCYVTASRRPTPSPRSVPHADAGAATEVLSPSLAHGRAHRLPPLEGRHDHDYMGLYR